MGTRPILSCTKERTADGKPRMYWEKGPPTYITFGEALTRIKNTAKGLLGLPGIAEAAQAAKQKGGADGDELVVALLAETAAEWQIAAQVGPRINVMLGTVVWNQ
eukprot:SAG11_NODE_335_length_10564_cov_23.976015_6_plen_105_part_00